MVSGPRQNQGLVSPKVSAQYATGRRKQKEMKGKALPERREHVAISEKEASRGLNMGDTQLGK